MDFNYRIFGTDAAAALPAAISYPLSCQFIPAFTGRAMAGQM